MSALLPLLAELDQSDQELLKNLARTGSSQTAIMFTALTVVVVLCLVFVYVFRKRILRRRRHHHHHHPAPTVAPAAETQAASETSGKRRKKIRRSRHEHRPLNPTLAETHGLPPIRPEGAPPPTPPP